VPAPVVETSAAPDTAGNGARDRAAREAAEREARLREERERARATLDQTILFAFDRSDLTSDARANLDAKLAVLRADVSLTIAVEGHADERGASEYNLALGMRRAAAARRYLVLGGIAPDRVTITSLGEERPVCTDSSESCWRLNRRDEFSPSGP